MFNNPPQLQGKRLFEISQTGDAQRDRIVRKILELAQAEGVNSAVMAECLADTLGHIAAVAETFDAHVDIDDRMQTACDRAKERYTKVLSVMSGGARFRQVEARD